MIYFSFVIAILYHFGVIQTVIRSIAFVMEFTMGITAAESFNAAGNIFIGMVSNSQRCGACLYDVYEQATLNNK